MFETLQEQEERYRKLVELFPDGVAILQQGSITFVNRAGQSLLKVSSLDEVIGRPFSDFIDPGHRLVFESQLALMEEGGHQVPWMEQILLPLTGQGLPVEIAGIPFQHEGKSLCQVIFRDITERKLARERLEQMAHYDLLTGLPNRSFFFEHLARMLDQAQRYDDQMALLYLDLDRFKPVNDELGHEGGDILLKQVADRLQELLRRSDLIARIGGDEFVILLSKIQSPGDAELVASKILQAIARPFDIGGNERSIGVSIGIALFPRDGHDGSVLVKKADMAMYRAKRAGKNRYVLFAEGR
jgi:diguanylate cyclase (GGDEF)-like protein/PAS domain S-box-containing protein